MAGKTAISVCGVGGKTSISAMVANILDYANYKPSFLIGVGRVLNLQVPGRMSSGPHFIAEADEYVVSPGTDPTPRFMYHTPNVIVCTNIAHDHPDAYPSLTETKVAFQAFFDKLKGNPKGLLVVNGNSGPARQLNYQDLPVLFYGVSPHNNSWWVKETFVGQGKQMVTFVSSQGEEVKTSLIVPGQFNALNALASFIVARHLGVKDDIALQALQLFRGSMRRFEKVGEKDGIVYYDDYAHHPSQILATLRAAKQWLPLNKIVTVFQPHTYSRTKALLPQFAKSFTYADKVIITDIYASSREHPDPSISAYRLVEEIKKYHPNVVYVPFNDLVSHLKSSLQNQDALFTMGAGNIYVLHKELLA
jgi:UDP-N-acetylmuramate--alanine ligase